MNRTVKKIGLILAVIILLPAVFFTVYEINSLNENEKVLETIYTNQLNAILFTVNQYSEDVLRSYIAKINYSSGSSSKPDPKAIKAALKEAKSILYIAAEYTVPPAEFTELAIDSSGTRDYRAQFKWAVTENETKIKRLYEYSVEGYQKLEPVIMNGLIHLFFISNHAGKNYLFDFIIDPGLFINQLLGPKLLSVAQDQFIFRISNSSRVVFSTGNDNRPVQKQEPLWLAPEYRLGILLRGTTIEELVQERFNTNIIIIAILGVILIAGVWIVFRNIKKEIELAHIKSDFVSNVSHELRTPLALISMFAETLDLGRVRTEEKKKEYIKIISQETNRLSGIVNKILSFSKMEAGKRTYNFNRADINDVVEKVYETYKFHLQNKGFTSSFTRAENLPLINIDSEAVSEAMVNLIDNAMKYSEENKEVRISTGILDDSVYIEVKDKGIGISEENQGKIFDKFFRVTSGLVHNTKGTGLGLTLVKHIVEAHKGRIDLKSRLWEGSSFRLIFPINNSKKSR